MRFGSGKLTFDLAEGWGDMPEGWIPANVPGIAVDSEDRVYMLGGRRHPVTLVMVFDRQGDFLTSWGGGLFENPHGIFVGPDDSVYCADEGSHTVRKFSPDGRLLLTLGTDGQPSDTGHDGTDYRTIKKGGPPFNRPSNVAISPWGEIYVTDGYGNARIHKFSPSGKLMLSWGEPGAGPGQFAIPHGICVDQRGTVYVADRQNNRIQVFTPEGKFITQWIDLTRPTDLFLDAEQNMYVAELGDRVGISQGMPKPTALSPWSRISVLSLDGKVLARWGEEDGAAPGSFFAAHGICTDSHGDLYVSEVVASSGRTAARIPPGCHVFQKFVRVG